MQTDIISFSQSLNLLNIQATKISSMVAQPSVAFRLHWWEYQNLYYELI